MNKRRIKCHLKIEITNLGNTTSFLALGNPNWFCFFFDIFHLPYCPTARKFQKKLKKALGVLGHFVGCCPCLILQGMIVLRPFVEHLTLELLWRWLQVTYHKFITHQGATYIHIHKIKQCSLPKRLYSCLLLMWYSSLIDKDLWLSCLSVKIINDHQCQRQTVILEFLFSH